MEVSFYCIDRVNGLSVNLLHGYSRGFAELSWGKVGRWGAEVPPARGHLSFNGEDVRKLWFGNFACGLNTS